MHLALILVVLLLLAILTMQILKFYTHHGKTLAVPDFTGFTETEVQKTVKENKLRYSIIDSVFVPDVIPGSVIGQHPEIGYMIKQNRTIYLTIAAISPEKVVLPVLVDVSLREAKNRLDNAGLRLGSVIYQPSEFINLVLDKQLRGEPLPDDTTLVKGTAIDLIVGKGLSNEVTEVPTLLGIDLEEAKSMLYNVGLNVGALVYDGSFEANNDSVVTVVWKQSPEGGSGNVIELGTSVDLWLTADQEKIDLLTAPEEEMEIDPETETEIEF